MLQQFINLNYKLHLLLSFSIRLVMVAYGVYHDEVSDVKYTDVDYKVFTDASRHILHGNSPYDRPTYRYSPLVAISLIPNILLHHTFGKILFCLVDVVVAILIRQIVKNTLKEYECYRQKLNKTTQKQILYQKYNKKKSRNTCAKCDSDWWADVSMLCWLYNPLTIAVGTRGNCDSIACFFVLITLYFLQCKRQYFIAGLMHGLSVHFRLYPIIYSLSYFMFLSKFAFYTTEDGTVKKNIKAIKTKKQIKNVENKTLATQKNDSSSIVPYNSSNKRTIFNKQYLLYLIPNFDQIKLIFGCLLALTFLTGLFYHLYGYRFLYETYVYHLVRKDIRHNFSLYFYLQYLTAWVKNIGLWQKVLMILPQVVLLLVFSVRYGLNRFSLNFSILTQTIVMVIYNRVLTSQYFVWVMGILPLCLWQIKMSRKTAIYLTLVWFLAQAAWLLPAYLLEFRGKNTFLFIWIQGVSFFCANIAVLGRLITCFMPEVKTKFE